MTVLFGNTPDAYVTNASGAPTAGLLVSFYTDTALTSRATGLTDEDGSPSDSSQPAAVGRIIGSTVTSKTGGVLSFGAPDGTTVLYYNRGDGKAGRLYPTVPTGGGTSVVSNTIRTNTRTVGGDSVARGSGDTTPIWTQRIATAEGKSFNQAAYAGQASEAIVRLGALDLLTDAAVTVPAGTTATAVTFGTLGAWAPVAYDGTSGSPGFICNAVTPAGTILPLTLYHDANGNAGTGTKPGWTFVRTSAGTSFTLPIGTVFHCTENDTHRNDDLLLVLGTNYPGTIPGDTTGAIFIRDIDLLRRYWGNDRITLMGAHMRPGDPTPQPTKIYFNAVNKAKMGNRFIDLMSAIAPANTATGGYSVGFGMSYMGVTPSSDDLTKLSNGQVPTSVMSDGTHPGPPLYLLMQDLALQSMATYGDYVGSAPKVNALATGAAPTASNLTASTVDITPAAVTGANGYCIQYRVLGAPTWISGPNTSGAAVTVTGLTNGTSYQFQAVPVDLRGFGTPSASVTAATTGTAPVVLMSDSFGGGDTTNINARTPDILYGGTARVWATSNAFLGISSGVLKEPDVSGRQTTGLFDATVTDGRLQVTIRALPSAGTTMTLFMRCTAAGGNCYSVVITDTGLVRLNKNNGASSTLSTAPAGTAKVGDIFEGYAVGNVQFVRQNGAILLSAADTDAAITGTKWGVNLQRASAIDDLILWDK